MDYLPKKISNFTHFAKIVAEYTSIISIVGLSVSYVANEILFWCWGLSFTQLSSPADIVMSGLHFVVFLLLLAILIAIGYMVAKFRTPSKYFDKIIASSATSYILMLAFISVLILVDEAPVLAYIPVLIIVIFGAMLGGYILTKIAGYMASPSNNKKYTLNIPNSRSRNRRSLIIASGMMLCFITFYAVFVLFNAARFGGYPIKQMYVIGDSKGCINRILWIGERAVVVACSERLNSGTYEPRDINVLLGEEVRNLRLSVGRPDGQLHKHTYREPKHYMRRVLTLAKVRIFDTYVRVSKIVRPHPAPTPP